MYLLLWRLDDQVAGLEVVEELLDFIMKRVQTQVLAASIRNVHSVRSFYNGADVVTMPPQVFKDMYNHILTDKGLEIFQADIDALNK